MEFNYLSNRDETNGHAVHLNRRQMIRGTIAAMLCASTSRCLAAKATATELAPFNRPSLVKASIQLGAEAQELLRKKPRDNVEAAVRIDTQEFSRVALHLKSRTSFMELDKKPSFTLSFNKHVDAQRCFGMRKIYLNNSAQDSTYLCEFLATEVFRRANVPCARVAWASVEMDKRPMGLYVLKEGFSKDFLDRHFKKTSGNFYDGGLHQDIFNDLELDTGSGPKDHSDLKRLHAAAQLPDLSARWQELQKLVDMERFVSMMAAESLTCHVDGYSLMQNNYRIYFDPTSQKAVFIAHGMDRMFEQVDYPVEPPMRAELSLAVLGTPEGRKQYRERLKEVVEKVFQLDWMMAAMDEAIRLLKPVEPTMEGKAEELRQRLKQRFEFLKKQKL